MAWHDGSKSALEWFNDDKDNNDEDCDHDRYRSVTEAGQRSRFLAELGFQRLPERRPTTVDSSRTRASFATSQACENQWPMNAKMAAGEGTREWA
jgi:hypothetical protein